METVSQLLGHKKTEVTQRHYNKWILERQQNMEAVVRNSWSRVGHAKKTDAQNQHKHWCVRSDLPFTKRSGDMVYTSWLD